MACPDTGTWRAWIDEETSLPGANAHLRDCAYCASEVGRVRGDSSHAASAVALLDPPAVAPAAVRTTTSLSNGRNRDSGARRRWVASAAAALVAVMVVGTPAGRATAADFLALFRSERVAAVAADEDSLRTTAEALGQLGHADDVSEIEPVEVADVAAAMKRTGLAVTVPDPATLPEDASARPAVGVTDEQQLRFTFRAAATRAYLSQFDEGDRPLPAGYDGATLVVNLPAAVLQNYRGPDGTPALLVGHSGTVTAEVDGDIDLDALRGFLLDLPGLPEPVVRQLAAIDDWRTTLPVPIPIDHLGSQETTVDGADAILVEEPAFGSGLLWQRDGVVTGVAGRLDEAALRAVVDSLRAP